MPDKYMTIPTVLTTMPINPKVAAKKIRKYLSTLTVKAIIFSGITKLEMATADTIMIMILLTSPACVAA
ncbi:hypothetical protein D3C77_723130 [compost metagenome]